MPFEKCVVRGVTKMSVTVKNSNTVPIIIWDDNSLNLNKEFTSNTKKHPVSKYPDSNIRYDSG